MNNSSAANQVATSGFDPIAAARSVIPALEQVASATEAQRQVDQSAVTTCSSAGITERAAAIGSKADECH